MTSAIRTLFFLIPLLAWAPPAGAPEPTVDDVIQQQINRRAMELIQRSAARSAGRNPSAAALASEADAVKQAVAEALAAKPAAAPPAPPVTPAAIQPPPAAPPVVVTAPTQISIPQEVRDSIVSLCSLLITAGIAAGLAWMRSHFAFMQEAAANQTITSSANGLGALLEQALAKQGQSLSSVSISDPNVAAAAQKLMAAYPQWGPLVGLTQDIAERKVLAGAIQQSATPLTQAPPPAPARQNPAEPGATSPPPPAAPAPTVSVTAPAAGATIITAEAAPTTVPTPPMDLEVHP